MVRVCPFVIAVLYTHTLHIFPSCGSELLLELLGKLHPVLVRSKQLARPEPELPRQTQSLFLIGIVPAHYMFLRVAHSFPGHCHTRGETRVTVQSIIDKYSSKPNQQVTSFDKCPA
jgi:hypothetical protein